MSAAEREPPGWPLPAVAIMVMTWRRNCLAIFSSLATGKPSLADADEARRYLPVRFNFLDIGIDVLGGF